MPEFTTRPPLSGTFGMASSTHWLATATAMSVLERGGNAVDAACAAAFVLHVVEPHLNGPGGDAPIIVSIRGGAPMVLCGQGPAPAGATAAHYRDQGLDLVPGTGPLAAAIPGAVDAWLVLLRDHGTWPLRDVLDHAIGLAEQGHDPLERVGATVESVRGLFEEHWPTSAAVYLPDGRPPRPGTLFRNPALAATWRRLVAEAEAAGHDREAQLEAARRAWRQGFVAEAIERTAATAVLDASGSPHAGTLTAADMGAWSPTWEEPILGSWGDWTVAKCGPWSQGPAFLQQLAMLSDVAPGELAPTGAFDADAIHRLVESAKLAFADRDAFYGDSADVPLTTLISPAYNEARRDLIGPASAPGLRPGRPDGLAATWPAHVRRLLAGGTTTPTTSGGGDPTVDRLGRTGGDTCHLDVVDRWGTMVAATPSGGWLQSNPVVPELGFPLGTRLQMCWLDEGLPASLVPGRRPRTTLSPSLALFEGVPTVAFGTPGGDQQDMWTYHFFVNLADRFARRPDVLELQAAIDAPNWHTDAVVGSFWPRGFEERSLTLEANHDPAVTAALRGRGHDVRVGPVWSEGRTSAVARHPRSGILFAGANPRGCQGLAAGR